MEDQSKHDGVSVLHSAKHEVSVCAQLLHLHENSDQGPGKQTGDHEPTEGCCLLTDIGVLHNKRQIKRWSIF